MDALAAIAGSVGGVLSSRGPTSPVNLKAVEVGNLEAVATVFGDVEERKIKMFGVETDGKLLDEATLGWTGGAANCACILPSSYEVGSQVPDTRPKRVVAEATAEEIAEAAAKKAAALNGRFASTLNTLEGRLDSAKKAAAKGAQETSLARMHGAAQTIKLKKMTVELEGTLRECAKETRLRKKAEDRVKELEAALKHPSSRNAQGLTLEASQALIEKLHESKRKSKESEARLKEVEKELQKEREVAPREVEAASAKLRLEQKVSGLMQELQQAQSHIRALEVEAAVSAGQRKHVDAAVQIDGGDMFSLVDSRCEDLLRGMHQAEREKLSAEAYSIATKAQLARAEHRVSCLEREIQSHRPDLSTSHSPDSFAARGATNTQVNDSELAKELSKCQQKLQACRAQQESARDAAKFASRETEERMGLLLAQRLEHHRSGARVRESELEDSVLDLQRRLLQSEQAIQKANAEKQESERTAQQGLMRADDCLLQMNRTKAALNTSDQKVREGEVQKAAHLRAANEVVQAQVRMLRDAIQRIRASGRCNTCNGKYQELANRISLQIEAMRGCDFSDMQSLCRLAKQSGHPIELNSLISPRSPSVPSPPGPFASSSPRFSHLLSHSSSPTEGTPVSKSSSENGSPIVMPIYPPLYSHVYTPPSLDPPNSSPSQPIPLRTPTSTPGKPVSVTRSSFLHTNGADDEVVRAYSHPIPSSERSTGNGKLSPSSLPFNGHRAQVRNSARALLSLSSAARDGTRSASPSEVREQPMSSPAVGFCGSMTGVPAKGAVVESGAPGVRHLDAFVGKLSQAQWAKQKLSSSISDPVLGDSRGGVPLGDDEKGGGKQSASPPRPGRRLTSKHQYPPEPPCMHELVQHGQDSSMVPANPQHTPRHEHKSPMLIEHRLFGMAGDSPPPPTPASAAEVAKSVPQPPSGNAFPLINSLSLASKFPDPGDVVIDDMAPHR